MSTQTRQSKAVESYIETQNKSFIASSVISSVAALVIFSLMAPHREVSLGIYALLLTGVFAAMVLGDMKSDILDKVVQAIAPTLVGIGVSFFPAYAITGQWGQLSQSDIGIAITLFIGVWIHLLRIEVMSNQMQK